MRTKRSKDMRLVDKFNKHKEDVAAESRLHQPVKPAAADEDYTHAGEEEEGALNVRDEGLLCSVQNKASKMCWIRSEKCSNIKRRCKRSLNFSSSVLVIQLKNCHLMWLHSQIGKIGTNHPYLFIM